MHETEIQTTDNASNYGSPKVGQPKIDAHVIDEEVKEEEEVRAGLFDYQEDITMDDLEDEENDEVTKERKESKQKTTSDSLNAENAPQGKTVLTGTMAGLSPTQLDILKRTKPLKYLKTVINALESSSEKNCQHSGYIR